MRNTVANVQAQVDVLRTDVNSLLAGQAEILALLRDGEPAKVARKAPAKPKARKAPAKKVTKPAPKGAQTRETLSRKDWNRTLTTLAKTQPKGSGAYALVLASWADMQEARDAGMTPREALALVIG